MSPLIKPVISIAAGTNCPTTISAKKPRKIQTKIPSFPAGAAAAANTVAGTNVPIKVAIVLMTYSFHSISLFDNVKSIERAKGLLKVRNIYKNK